MPDVSFPYVASREVLDRARKIKLFLMDVDGTLTDGGVCLISTTDGDGSSAASVSEMKIFNAKDGQGLSLAHTMGIQTGFITGRRSPAVAKRAEELKVTFVYLGQAKKTEAFEECVRKAGVTEEEVAYMGDDLPDIPLAQRAGLARRRTRSDRTNFEGAGTLGRSRAASPGLVFPAQAFVRRFYEHVRRPEAAGSAVHRIVV